MAIDSWGDAGLLGVAPPRSHVHLLALKDGAHSSESMQMGDVFPGKMLCCYQTKGLDTERAEARVFTAGTEAATVWCAQCPAHIKSPRCAGHRHPFARGVVPSGQCLPLISVPPRWSCRPTRKLCLCHPRLRRGSRSHPHTPRCDSARPQPWCWERRSCLEIRFFASAAPVARANRPADSGTVCLCTLAGLLFPWGLGDAHSRVNALG